MFIKFSPPSQLPTYKFNVRMPPPVGSEADTLGKKVLEGISACVEDSRSNCMEDPLILVGGDFNTKRYQGDGNPHTHKQKNVEAGPMTLAYIQLINC